MHKQIVLACLISSCFQAHAQETEFVFHSPKTTGKTAAITAAAGVGTTAGVYYALTSLYELAELKEVPFTLFGMLGIPVTNWLRLDFFHKQQITVGEHALKNLTLGFAGGLGLLAAWIAYSYQPEGKFAEARNRLENALDNDVLNELLEAEGDLIANINNEYASCAYPRVAAHNHFARFHKSLKKAAKWLREAINDSHDEELITFGQNYLLLIEAYQSELVDCINIIKKDPDWLNELQGYETHKLRKAQENLVRVMNQPRHVFVHHV